MTSMTDAWSYWKNLFFSITDSHAPLVSVRMKVKDLSSEWIDAELRTLLRARNLLPDKVLEDAHSTGLGHHHPLQPAL